MPGTGTILGHLESAFVEHAKRVAVEAWPGGERLTYAQLDAASAALAAELRRRGVGPGTFVPLVMPRGIDFLVAVVAILRCGAAYAPIDPAAPGRGAMLEPLEAKVVIGRGPGMLDPAAGPSADFRPGEAPQPEVGPDAPAYVMYTSGSTGTPKGVVVPHRAVVRLVVGADYARFGPDHRWGVLSAVAFDASTLEVWGALLHGGCCVVQTLETPTLADLAEYLTSGKVSDTWLTASLFNAMVEEHPGSMAGMSQLLTGGERESVPHIRRFLELCPDVRLIHGYGPTENTTFSLCHTITRDDAAGERIPIGSPIHGSTMRIVEPGARPDAPATALMQGELLVGGLGLALGYLGDPARTAEKFVVDSQGERWYRTGDLVRLREDGAAVFMGRVDRQVKIRGHRIEPDGVEAQLAACPGVSQAAIAVTGETAETRRMIAFYVPSANAGPADVRAQLAERLPPTMLPERFVPVRTMPMGTTGKVDRSALLSTLDARGGTPHRSTTAVETRLMELFRTRLGRAIGPDERFQDAGGHSLLAMRLSADVRRGFGVALPAAEILRRQTIARIAALVETLPPIDVARATDEADPIGDIRRRASLEHGRDPTGKAMLVHQAWHLKPGVSIDRLRSAWIALLARHDALRTSVLFSQQRPMLVEHDPSTAPVFHAEHDRLGAPDTGDARVLAAVLRTISPQDPPARLHVWAIDDGSQLLVMVYHHAAIDAWSLDLIERELESLLEGALLATPLPYAEYVRAEKAMRREDLALELARRIARSATPASELPHAGPQPGLNVPIAAAGLTMEALDTRARSLGVSPMALAAAALGMVLRERFGEPGRWLLTPFARRPSEDLQRVVGCCLDMRPIEAKGGTFEDAARSIDEQLLRCQEDTTLPLEALIDAVRRIDPRRAHDPIRFGLTYRHIDDAPRAFAGSSLRPIDLAQPAARFALALHVERRASGLRVWVEASADAFDAATLSAIGGQWVARLLGSHSDTDAHTVEVEKASVASTLDAASPSELLELSDLWHELLGTRPETTSDFFVDGGTSLLAMRLAAAIHRRLGRRLLLNQFLQRPTFEGLARSIRDDAEHPFAEFADHAARADAPDAPWCIAIPGSTGRAVDLYRLWRELGKASPRAMDTLAFDMAAIADGEAAAFRPERFFARFTALAHAHALASGRRGPITLLGYSLGGLVALDMAGRLCELGHDVRRVVLLDAYAPCYLSRTPMWFLGKVHARLRHGRRKAPRNPVQPAVIDIPGDQADSRARWRAMHHRIARWQVPSVSCEVVLVRSAPAWQYVHPVWRARTNGFGPQLRGALDIRVLDVEHLGMLTTDAPVVARALRDVLAAP